MDSNELNKIAGAVIGSLLLFTLLGFFSGQVFGTGGHHGDEVLAFALPIEAEGAADDAEEVDLASLVAEADVARGEKLFAKCKSCHKIENGANATGPHLWNVVGRPIASVNGFGYSAALQGLDGTWDLEHLSAFIEKPSTYAPGTTMSFAGYPDAADRVNLIAYLNEAGDAPVDLMPEGSEAAAEEPAASEEAATQEAAAEAPATEEPAAEEAATEASAAEAPATEEPAAEEAATEEPAAEEAATEEPAAEEAATEEPAAEETATEEPAAEEAATQEAAAEALAAEEPATEEPAAADATATETAAEAAPEAASTDSPYAALLAAADPAAGEAVFRRCRACHKLEEGKNGVGPSLWGVVGREIGAVDGFRYSEAMKTHGGTWDLATLDAYLENPKGYIPGNKMAFGGLKDAQERISVITYINQADGSPEPLE